VGSYEKLAEFENGKDIEELFNRLRPKYPIRKYIDVVGYNSKMELRQFLEEIKTKTKHTKNKIIVGVLDDRVIQFLRDKNVPVHTKEIFLTHKGLSHLARESKKRRGAGLSEEDILRIPEILKNPHTIYFDKNSDKLNVLYCKDSITCEKIIKIVIDTKAYHKKFGKITLIKTAGYVVEANLKEYIEVLRNAGGR